MARMSLPKNVTFDGVDQLEMIFEGKSSALKVIYYWHGNKLMVLRKGLWKIHLKTVT